MSEFIVNTDDLTAREETPDVTYHLLKRMRRVNAPTPDGKTIYSHYLEIEAVGDDYWVVRYHGLHSVVGGDGLISALKAMYAWLVENGIPLNAEHESSHPA